MAPGLRERARRSASGREAQGEDRGEERSCPVCMELTKNDWFSFPCGHSICAECNGQMLARRFLSCPTCRTPREGVSQRQVEEANQARANGDEALEVERHASTIFLPDESGGANPFLALAQAAPVPFSAPSMAVPEDDDEALARVLQAEEMMGAHLPGTRTTSIRMAVHGPMRELVDQLLSPVPILEFLAQREVVRRANGRRGVAGRPVMR